MNWRGKEIKQQARSLVKSDYWHLWFASVLIVVLSYVTVIAFTLNSMEELPDTAKNLTEKLKTGDRQQIIAVVMVLAVGVFLLNSLIQMGITIFLKNPITIGARRMFVELTETEEHKGHASNLMFVFDRGYRNAVWTMFVRDVKVLIFFLLLIVPGIWQLYNCRMIPYILAESPELPIEEAFAESARMMKGQKWKVFLYDLSFIPWYLLGIVTFGVVLLFWVHPYKNLSDARLYLEIKKQTEE